VERWIEPLGLLSGPSAFQAVGEGRALPLAGGPAAFALVRLIEDGRSLGVVPPGAVPEDWAEGLHALTARPAPFAGLPAGRPLVDTFITEVSQDTWILFPWDIEPQFVQPIVRRQPR